MTLKYKFSIATLAVGLFMSSNMSAQAIDCKLCKTMSPEEMLLFSGQTSSTSIRYQIRGYLAEKFPNKGAGKAAAAALAASNGDRDKSIALYKEALALNPNLSIAAINLGHNYYIKGDVKNALKYFSLWYKKDSGFASFIRNSYFAYLEKLKDPERAEAFLREAEAKGYKPRWAVTYTRGIAARSKRDYQAADRYFFDALKQSGETEVFEAWIKNKQRLLNLRGASQNARTQLFQEGLRRARDLRSGGAVFQMAEIANNEFKSYKTAFKLYKESYGLQPTPEAATQAFAAYANYDFSGAMNVLERAKQDFPYNSKVNGHLSWAYNNFLFDIERSLDYARTAIANAPRDNDKGEELRLLNKSLLRLDMPDEALPYFDKYSQGLSANAQSKVWRALVDNRIHAKDFAAAQRALDKVQQAKKTKQGWINGRQTYIHNLRNLLETRDEFYRNNSFLKDWEASFGDSLRVTVEFATGKADIQPESYSTLKQAAQALKRSGGEKYVFLIEGHTDSRGSDEINMPLSQARAASVKAYLAENEGIENARIRTKGLGPRQPLTTNETERGRQANRRVEIRPYGNITSPHIATTGALDPRTLTISSDGRIAATGYGPIQVWDLERMVLLHELPRGGTAYISPNNRYLAAPSNYTDVSGVRTSGMYIYDLRTGLPYDIIINENGNDEISWNPYSTELAWTDPDGYVRIYNLKEKRVRAVARPSTTRGSQEMLWLKDGKHILFKVSKSDRLVMLDSSDLSTVHEFRGIDWLHALEQSADGRYVIAFDNNRRYTIWDTTTWKTVVANKASLLTAKYAYSHPSKPLLVAQQNFDGNNKLMLIDLSTGEIKASLKHDKKLRGGFSSDGRYFISNMNDKLTYHDVASLRPVSERDGKSAKGVSIVGVEATGQAVSMDRAGSTVWSLKTGRRVHHMDVKGGFFWRPVPGSDSKLFTVNGESSVVVFDAKNFTTKEIFSTDGKIVDVAKDNETIMVATVPRGTLPEVGRGPFKDPEGEVVVIEPENFRQVLSFPIKVVRGTRRSKNIYWPKIFFADGNGAGKVAVRTEWEDGYEMGATAGRMVTVHDLASGRQISSMTSQGKLSNLKWEKDGQQLALRQSWMWSLRDPVSGKQVETEPVADYWTIDLADGGVLEWNFDRIRKGDKSMFFPNNLRQVAVLEKQNMVLAITTSNKIKVLDLKTFGEALTISPFKNGEWIAYAPDGRFTASQNGTDGVFWSLGDNYLPFSALSDKFQRPNLVREMLASLSEGKPLPADSDEPDVEPEIFDAPFKVTMLSPLSSETKEESFLLRFNVTKLKPNLDDPEIVYSLNGRPVLKSRGFEEDAVLEDEETIGFSRRFSLKTGQNVIEASLKWKGANIGHQRVEVSRQGAASDKKLASNRQLWFFAVGVSDYEISTQNLNFADKDALSLGDLLEAQSGTLFSKVHTKILTNEDATERNVRIEMNEFLDQSKPEDVVIVFVAGHGVMDEEEKLYFITHDGDVKRPYTGMSVDRFRQYLENRPLNQSALLLLDICHAGAASRRVVAEDVVQDLAAGTDAIVFASSSGSQLSYEDASYGGGHGAFTAALLEGLRGLADNSTGNRDGVNSLQEMIIYTTGKVPQMTEGLQRPTIPNIANNVDYAISRAN